MCKMHKLLTSFILALLAMQATAQNARFVEADKTWHVVLQYKFSSISYDLYYCFTAESDTLINDVHYMRLFDMRDDGSHLAAIFREEDGRVYRYDADRQTEQLYYDFKLSPNDVFTFSTGGRPFDYQCTVTATEKLTLADGHRACKVTLSSIPLSWDYEGQPEATENIWIEGIGNICNPVYNILDNNGDGGGDYYVVTVKRGEELIYSRDLMMDIASVRDSSGEIRYYDMLGRPVDEKRGHGLVVTAGRKVWKK